MSTVLLQQQATPATPSAGDIRFWISLTNQFCSINSSGTVTIYGESVTVEQVQDIVGSMLVDSSSINVTYDDAGNIVSFDVLAGGVNHNALLNYVANEHINHENVSITAGTGLTGGGNLTASRTLSIPNSGVSAGSYGSANSVASFAVNALGFITSASNTLIAIPASQVTDFSEAVDDRVAALIQNGTGISWSYNDTSNTFAASLTNTGVAAGTYGNANAFPIITVDAQGRITSVSTSPSGGGSSVFGLDYFAMLDTNPATTSSTSFSACFSGLTARSLANGGAYRFGVFFTWTIDAFANDARFKFMVDGVQYSPELRREMSETTTPANQIQSEYMIFEVEGYGSNRWLTLDFAVETAGAVLSVPFVRVEAWRIT
jgi:hypothetical protein